MKIKVHTFASDGQDGSASVYLFPTAELAQAAEDEEWKDCEQIFNEATGWVIIDTDDFEEMPE